MSSVQAPKKFEIKSRRNCLGSLDLTLFLAVQDSSITDIVSQSVIKRVSQTDFSVTMTTVTTITTITMITTITKTTTTTTITTITTVATMTTETAI